MPHVEKFSFPVGIYKFAHIIRFINMHKIEGIFRKEIHHIIISTLKPDLCRTGKICNKTKNFKRIYLEQFLCL